MDAEEFKKRKKLTPLEARARLLTLAGWTIEKGRLEKEFLFKDFVHAVVFLNKIVNPIEEQQNYPRISIVYNRVKVSLFTHAAGALTDADFEMAKEFDQLAS